MNILDAVVTKVCGEPYYQYNKWWVEVHHNCYGIPGGTKLMFNTKDEALKVKPGYQFLT